MPTDCISFKNTNYFSSLICDYLDENPELKQFYNHFPNIESFRFQIDEKKKSFSAQSRSKLVKVIKEQYQSLKPSLLTEANIESLNQSNTFTITTGHQLNLFTGPLYFLYKIISTINLTKQLKQAYPDYNFVPVYWMATEDHDFEEINYFNFKGKKIHWNVDAQGAVGELNTKGLDHVLQIFSSELGHGDNADYLKNLFEKAYVNHNNLAEATRFLANALFKNYGLVIVDANSTELKRLFIPFIEMEMTDQLSYKSVSKSNVSLGKKYSIQVNPREINLFYLNKGLRERIIETDGMFKAFNTNISWHRNDLMKEIQEFPERFSPNVVMRPLYQEVILPNLCYIGGGGELAYWFQLKAYFNTVNVPFPILLLRNSVLVKTKKQSEKLKKLNISTQDLFLNQQELVNAQIKNISDVNIDFSKQKRHLQDQFRDLYQLANQTDKSFLGAVAAQEKKQLKGLINLEKRLLKAQKRKFEEHINSITQLQNELFPGRGLQERNLNFSELYLEFGERLIPILFEELKPLKSEFLVLTI